MNKTVFVTENGKRVRRTKWELILAQQVNKAANSDLKAAQYVTDQMFKYGLLNQDSDEAAPAKLTADEKLIFDDIARRIRSSEPTAQPDTLPDDNDPASESTEEDEMP